MQGREVQSCAAAEMSGSWCGASPAETGRERARAAEAGDGRVGAHLVVLLETEEAEEWS